MMRAIGRNQARPRIAVRDRLAVAVGVLLLGLPPLPRAYAGPGTAQNMLTTAANATLPAALTNLDLAVVYAKAYGMTCDGVHDDTTALLNAVAALGTGGNTTLYLPQGTCLISATLTVGNGSTSAISTVNGITIEGGGHPPGASGGTSGSLQNTGTILKWATGAAAGGTMMQILGPASGIGVSHIAFDANGIAGTCLDLISASNGVFPSVQCSNYTGTGIKLETQPTAGSLSDNSVFGTTANVFLQTGINTTSAGTTALSLDGYTGTGGHDSTRNQFIGLAFNIPMNTSTIGVRLAFTDQNTFKNLVGIWNGSNDHTACAIDFVGTTVGAGYSYPQTNSFDPTDFGVGGQACVDGLPNEPGTGTAIGQGNDLGKLTLLDAPVKPAGTLDRMVPYRAVGTGQFPTGGFWSEGGLNLNERSLRNKLVNSAFALATRGTSFTNPASGAYTLDQWKVGGGYSGQSFTVSQVAFSPGQTEVPYQPQDYLEWSGTASQQILLNQPVESVRTFNGRKATYSVWMRYAGGTCPTTPTVGTELYQSFGSGGSAGVTINPVNAVPLTTSWARYSYTMSVSSVSGKTIGVGDYLLVDLLLPPAEATTCTIDFALPQFEAGQIATAYEIRPAALDVALAGRYLRLAGTGAFCSWNSATQAELGLSWGTPMRAAPTLSLAPGVSTVTLGNPGSTAATTTGTASLSTINSSPKGVQFLMGAFTSQTAFRPCIGTSDFALLSAEY